jgi:hypothetical protein
MEQAREMHPVVRKPHGRGTPKIVVNRGKASMNAAADKALELNSGKIAHKLLISTLGGNVTSAKLLFALADGQIDCEDEVIVQGFVSLAERLAAEPQCSAEEIEAATA